MVTVAPASAVPVMAGWVSLVGFGKAVRTGASGGVVSPATGGGVISTTIVAEAGPVLPATSVAVAVRLAVPTGSGVVGVKLKAPPAPATTVPSTTLPLSTVTVAPASAVPVMTGVASPVVAGRESTVGTGGGVRSMTSGVCAASETLPAASVAVAVRLLAPSASAVVGVKLKAPSVPATTVPSVVPLLAIVTVAPASAAPVIVGVVSLVGFGKAVRTGAPGAARSTVSVTGDEAVPVLPAASVAVAVRLLAPPVSGVPGVRLKRPSASARAVPIGTPLFSSVTVVPASAVPVMRGVVSLVASGRAARSGAAGGLVSIVSVTGLDAAETLPSASAAVAVRLRVSSGSGAAGVKLKAPLASAIAVPSTVPLLAMVTVAPTSAVPVMVGVVSLVLPARW